jgi:hypothetical protein
VVATATLGSDQTVAVSLAAGKHTFTARYAGDGDSLGSFTSVDVYVRHSTSVALTLPDKKIRRKKRLSLVAPLASPSISGAALTGTVTIYVDGKQTLTASTGGLIDFKGKRLKAGKHKIYAVYSGDDQAALATSQTYLVRISGGVISAPKAIG